VEASLLPSKEIHALCKREIVAVIPREAPGCEELRTEFAIPFLNSWVVVLDGKGETLGSFIGDNAGTGCTAESSDRFPTNLAALIEQGLERQESVQELERHWRSNPRDAEAFNCLAERLQEMEASAKIRELCAEAAATRRLPRQLRDDFRLRAFIVRTSDRTEDLSDPDTRAAFVREGEKLLIAHAGHPRASELLPTLFYTGYNRYFDVPAHSARGIARLRRAARKVPKARALRERISELVQMRTQWIESTTEHLRTVKDEPWADYVAASLGDADAAIRYFSKPGYSEYPAYREALEAARRKKKRGRQRARVARVAERIS
jgi:hypothetical protein